ncbi:MAG: DUF5675 family protein [Bacteroidota bacterium]
MKHFAALLFVAVLTITILLFVNNPELLEEIWLWIVGFIGYIVLLLERGFQAVASAVRTQPGTPVTPTNTNVSPATQLPPRISELERRLQEEEKTTSSTPDSTITVLRYLDDGHTSLGLIFFRKKFFAYALEDTHQTKKVVGKTGVPATEVPATCIPAGTYHLSFHQQDNPLTVSYRKRFPWFTYHLELKEVPGFGNIYIHIGNDHRGAGHRGAGHRNMEGCILIADGMNTTSSDKMIMHSRLAFERLYKRVSALLKTDETVTIKILDETWFAQAQLQLT